MGTVKERIEALMGIAAKQEQILVQVGLDNPWVTPAQYAATLQALVELGPVNDPSRYFNSPEMLAQAAQQPAQGEGDPQAAQDAQKGQIALQKAQIDAQAKVQVAQIGSEAKRYDTVIDAQAEIEAARIRAEVDRQTTDLELRLKEQEMRLEALLERYKVDMKVQADTRLRSPVG